jgi:two-component system chemotaxis response regulator CheY
MKILVIDDSVTMRRIIKNCVSRAMKVSEISEAGDGLEGIEAYKKSKPDLICLDWNMPNMDGLGFLKWLRTVDVDTPVIMITTEGSKSSVITALKNGANQYIIKPFTPDVLIEKLIALDIVV